MKMNLTLVVIDTISSNSITIVLDDKSIKVFIAFLPYSYLNILEIFENPCQFENKILIIC